MNIHTHLIVDRTNQFAVKIHQATTQPRKYLTELKKPK